MWNSFYRRLFIFMHLPLGLLACENGQNSVLKDSDSEETVTSDTQADFEQASRRSENAPQHVMAWIPSYGVKTGKLVWGNEELGAAQSLTRLGLQFWTLSETSGVDFLAGVEEADVDWFVEKAREEGVKVLATIVNDGAALGEPGFNWDLVRSALAADGVEKVSEQLLNLVERYELDGIDLDLEAWQQIGPEAVYTQNDRALFADLVQILSEGLHSRNKLLTVASFSYNGRAIPQPSWWADWVGQVDTLHAMGYFETYAGGLGRADYQEIQNAAVEAGYSPEQLLLGLPVWLDAWSGLEDNRGVTHVKNIEFINHCLSGESGVALWAFDHPAAHKIPQSGEAPWSSSSPWSAVKKLKRGGVNNDTTCIDLTPDRALFDDMSQAGKNLYAGNWLAVNDKWDRAESGRAAATSVLTFDGSYDLGFGEGVWGDISKGYRIVDERQVLSARVEVTDVEAIDAWGGLWMEMLPRDCSLFDEIGDECNWQAQGLQEFAVSAFEKLAVELRCDRGKKLTIELESKTDVVDQQSSLRQEVDCTGQWQEVSLTLPSETEFLARLGFSFRSSTAPESLNFDIGRVGFTP